MNKIKVMSVFGTRPEAIKMAPLVKELEQTEEIESRAIYNGIQEFSVSRLTKISLFYFQIQ